MKRNGSIRRGGALLMMTVAVGITGCGGASNIHAQHSARVLKSGHPMFVSATDRSDPDATQIVTLPGLGSISYECNRQGNEVAASFAATGSTATEEVSVAQSGKTIARAAVQPDDPGTPPTHTLSTPFAAYRSLHWLIWQATEAHLLVARVTLDFVVASAKYQGQSFQLCDMPHWTADVRNESFLAPAIAVEGIPRTP